MKQIFAYCVLMLATLSFVGCGTEKEDEPNNPSVETPDNENKEDNSNPEDSKDPSLNFWHLEVTHNWDAFQREWKNRCPEMDEWIEAHKADISQESGFPPLNGSVVYKFTLPAQSTEEISEYCNHIISWSIGWDLPISDTEKYWAYDVFYIIANNYYTEEKLDFYPDVKDSYPY